MKSKSKLEAAVDFLQNISFGGDYEETARIKEYISLAIEALQKELSEMEVSE